MRGSPSSGQPSDLLDAHVSLAGLVTLEREIDAENGRPAAAGNRLQMAEGMNLGIEAPSHTLDVVGALDGEATVGAVVDEAASRLGLSGPDAKRLRRESLELVRELLELGALRFT